MNILHASRIDYTPSATISLFTVNGDWWGYVLEDRMRPSGVKVAGTTCIPAGRYPLRVTLSSRFGRWMPELENVPGFAGVRLHGGNTVADSEGCPLIAAHRPGRERVLGSLESRLMEFLRSQIAPVAGESKALFWSRLPETWYVAQDGPLASGGPLARANRH